MDSTNLESDVWRRLIHTVFRPGKEERALALLVDLPDRARPDNEAWKQRRELAIQWHGALSEALADDGFEVELWHYPNAGTNNGDLPAAAWPASSESGVEDRAHVDQLPEDGSTPFAELFERIPIFVAMSELSATAPLKVAAKRHGFRAATMPRFSSRMMPALGLDLAEVDRRCRLLKELLDRATAADFLFTTSRAPGSEKESAQSYRLRLDLRHRQAHASSGLLHGPGTAGNLPSGETYIVPYEGELEGDASVSEGFLPVSFQGHSEGPTGDYQGDEVVIYEIQANKAVQVLGDGPVAERERQNIAAEPAYANIAELGLGVLGDLGIEPIGEILLDEKLGLHIAFGRSDHFGGAVGPKDFSSPDAVVHIDRVYLPGDAVLPVSVDLEDGEGRRLALMRDGRYVLDFSILAEEAWG